MALAKDTFICPVPKKGSPFDIENYRGISLQSVMPKLFDKSLTYLLKRYASAALPPEQFGFREHCSTTDALLRVTTRIQTNIKHKTTTDAVFIDITKAFDRISHRAVIASLAQLGAPLHFVSIIARFLVDRCQILKLDAVEYTEFDITPPSSVPQGSHI